MTARFTTLSLCLFTISLTQAAHYASMNHPRVIEIHRVHGSSVTRESFIELLRAVGAKKEDQDLARAQLIDLAKLTQSTNKAVVQAAKHASGVAKRDEAVADRRRRQHSNRP